MRQKITYILINSVIFAGFMPVVAYAVFHEGLRERRDAVKDEIQEERQDLRQQIQEKRDTLRQELQEKRGELRGKVRERQAAIREEFQTRLREFQAKREALRQELEEKRAQFRDEREKRVEELKKKVGEKRAERIEQFFKKMLEKFDAAIERLKRFADRIEERINRAEANGKDVTEARAKLLTARERIADAEKALEDAKAQYTEAAKDPDFKAAFKKVREIVHGVVVKLKEAHRALVEVITTLKGIGGGEGATEEEESEALHRNVEMTAGGFAPSTLRVKASTTVTFTNRDSEPHWPASGVHPTHEICPGFDALKGLAKDESYSFTFTDVKTCPMHDHLNPEIKGSIVVE